MKRTGFFCIIITLCLVLSLCSVTMAQNNDDPAEPEPTPSVSTQPEIFTTTFVIQLSDGDGDPLADTEVSIIRETEDDVIYQDVTDEDGKVFFPDFPLSNLTITTGVEDEEPTGAAKLHLYPADKTEILNNPDVQPLQSKVAMPLDTDINTYEVNINQKAEAIDFLFALNAENTLALTGAYDGDSPDPEPSPSPTDSPTPTDSPSPAPTDTAAPTDSPQPTAAPTAQPTAAPTAQPTVAPTVQPTVAPTAQPTVAPTPTPAPQPIPTTILSTINMKMNLMTQDGVALPNYIATLNNDTQSVANADGTIYFAGIDPHDADTLKVFNAEKNIVGVCNLKFEQGNVTTVASVGTGGVYNINYAQGTQDVFINTAVNPGGNENTLLEVQQASSRPLPAGTHTQQDTPSASPSPGASGDPTDTPSPAQTLEGILVDSEDAPMAGITVELKNNATKATLSGATDSGGIFSIPSFTTGGHTFKAISGAGDEIGRVNVNIENADSSDMVYAGGVTTIYVKNGLPTLYIGLQSEGNGVLTVTGVSETALPLPQDEETPTPPPTPEATVSPEASAAPTATPQPQRQGPDHTTTMLIVILIIVAAAVAILLVVYLRRKKRG